MFVPALGDGRVPADALANLFDDAVSNTPASNKKARSRASRIPAVTVRLGEHDLVAMNSHYRMAFRMEQNTIAFMSTFMVSMARKVIHAGNVSSNSPTESVPSPAAFHFTPPTLPNHRDKVVWSPTQNAWLVSCKVDKHIKRTTKFAVDMALPQEEREREKARQYGHAVETWNIQDRSKRPRIPVGQLGDDCA